MSRIRQRRDMRVWVVLGLVALLLTGCGTGAPVKEAFTAAGDGAAASDVKKTAVFLHNDDLNLVVTLNTHNRTLEIEAIFTAPDGSTFGTDTLEADPTVGEVLLGLDWETRAGVSWTAGEWQVQVLIDGKVEKTQRFTVQPAPITPEPTPAS